MQSVLAHRCEHGVAFEAFDTVTDSPLDSLRQGEVDQVETPIGDANVVEFEIPVAVADLVQFIECSKHLLAHFDDFQLELGRL